MESLWPGVALPFPGIDWNLLRQVQCACLWGISQLKAGGLKRGQLEALRERGGGGRKPREHENHQEARRSNRLHLHLLRPCYCFWPPYFLTNGFCVLSTRHLNFNWTRTKWVFNQFYRDFLIIGWNNSRIGLSQNDTKWRKDIQEQYPVVDCFPEPALALSTLQSSLSFPSPITEHYHSSN